MCYAFATGLVLIYIGGLLLGIGFAWTTTTIVGYVVNVWSRENKGTIMGLILCSNGVGGAIAVNVLTPIIESNVNGYKTAYFIIAGIVLIIFLLMLFLFRDKPKNATEEQTQTQSKKSRGRDWIGLDIKQTTKKVYFYLSLIAIFLTGVVLQGVTGVFTPLMDDMGIPANVVAIILTVSMLSLAGFKFISGFIYDKCGLRVAVTVATIASIILMLFYMFITNSTLGIVIAFASAVISAVALPLETIMLPIYAMDLFGQKSYDQHLGIVVSVNTAGYAVGAPLMNLVYDLTLSYHVGLIIATVLMIITTVILQLVITASNKERKLLENAKS